MKYCTDDGKKIFDTEEEVFEYERKLKEEKIRKEKFLQEKADRLEEIQSQSKILKDLLINYYNDFGLENNKITMTIGIFDDVFRLLKFI